MGEYDYETVMTFRKPNHFWKFLNKKMVISDSDALNDSGNKKYHLVFFSSLPNDFNDCIDSTTGCLKTSSLPTGMERIAPSSSTYTDVTFPLGVSWLTNGENGFTLFLDEKDGNDDPVDINYEIADDTTLWVKGVALCKTSGTDGGTDYVVAFAEQSTRIRCENTITIQANSSFVGHSSCGDE